MREVREYFYKILILQLNKISNMAEFENQEVDEIVTDEVETIDNEETELTVEDYKKERARREKAEKTLVELKKQLKEKEKAPESTLSEKDLELRDEIRDFVKENPEFREYKDDLAEYAKTFYSKWEKIESAIRKAKALVENDDKTIENRKKANLNISSWDEWAWKTVYTYADLEKMSQSDYNRVKELQLKWKVKFKN